MKFWGKTLGLFALMIIGFEIACRLFIGWAPRLRFDPHYDRLPEANQPVVQSTEGFSRGRTNELGHLDAPMPDPLPRDGILVIGDSYTEARQVSMEDRFTDRLGVVLKRRVYNVGHTGWSPINAIGFLENDLPKFQPSTVIIQVSGNDLADIVAPKRPHVVERKDGTFELSLPDRKKKGMGKKVQWLKDEVTRSAFAGDVMTSMLGLLGGGGDEGGGETSCADPSPLAQKSLPWIVDRLRHAHHDVHLLYLPMLDYHKGCIDVCASSRALYERVAASQGVELIDSTPALCARFAETRQPLHGFWNTVPGQGHLNSDGHEVIADLLAARLRARTADAP